MAGPSWDLLYTTAAAQEGHFSAQQAAEAGYSPQLLAKYLHNGRVQRIRRGVYRLVHFPPGDHEDLVVLWLWTEQQGVFSHTTALALHGLSDALPAHVHVTLPETWRQRRLRIPADLVLHHAAIPSTERAWMGTVPITSPARTLRDCAAAHLAPDLHTALLDALARGLVDPTEGVAIERLLGPRGGQAA